MQNKRVPTLEKPQTFLCDSLEAALQLGILTPADVVEHFGVATMIATISDPDHRAEMLAALKQADADTARELEVEFAGVLLKTAVKVGRVTASQICDAVGINGVVYYQSQPAVWSLLLKKEWAIRQDTADRELVGKMLQLIIELKLLDDPEKGMDTYRAIVLAITALALVKQMPAELVAQAWQLAMDKGEESENYTAVDALGVLTPELLAQKMDLTDLVHPLHAVARKYGWEAVAKPEQEQKLDTDEEVTDGQPPDPASIKPKPEGDEEVLELEAEEPSGVHPGAAMGSGGSNSFPPPDESAPTPPVEPAPLPPPPPAREPSDPFAHLPPAPPPDDPQPTGSMFPAPPPPLAPTPGVALGGGRKGPPPTPPRGRRGGG